MKSEVITIIIGIVGLIIGAWPLLFKGPKYFDYPFFEYDTIQSSKYAKRCGVLWKAHLLADIKAIYCKYSCNCTAVALLDPSEAHMLLHRL